MHWDGHGGALVCPLRIVTVMYIVMNGVISKSPSKTNIHQNLFHFASDAESKE